MGKSLIQSRNNITSKWNALYSTRPKRNSRNRAPVNYSDDKPVETPPIQETLPDNLSDSQSDENDDSVQNVDDKSPQAVFQGNEFLGKFDNDTFSSHPSFVAKTNDESNDNDSDIEGESTLQEIQVNDSQHSEEFPP